MNLSEISFELQKAQALYEEKNAEKAAAVDKLRDIEIEQIRAEAVFDKIKAEIAVCKSRIDILKDSSYNLRAEAKL